MSKVAQLISKIRRRFQQPSNLEILNGYDHPELIDVIYRKTVAYEPNGEWPEMRGASSVLDFGGGCGRHYKQAKLPTVRWAVVETPAMIEMAKEFSTERLQFFTTISDAIDWLGDVDVMHSDGAVQYTPNPLDTVRALCGVGAKKMLWNRLLFSDAPQVETQTSRLIDNGPGSIEIADKVVRYTRTGIQEADFLAAHKNYAIEDRGADWFRYRVSACH